MPMKTCNGAELYYELSGEGAPLVLVHGGWIDAKSWELVVPAFAEHFQVLAYDRRGHSRSRRPGAGSRRHDEDDLIALLDALDLAPAHLVGNSFGAAIVLAVAGRRPDLVRSVVAHEPPLVGVATAGSPLAALTDPVLATLSELVDLVRIGAARARRTAFRRGNRPGPRLLAHAHRGDPSDHGHERRHPDSAVRRPGLGGRASADRRADAAHPR